MWVISMKKEKVKKEKKEKTKPFLTEDELKKQKSRRAKVSLSCFVLLLAVGVVGNWYWENSDLSTKVNTVASEGTKTLGEATFVGATTEPVTENSYFSSARVDRQTARDESLEKLQKIVDSADENEAAHKTAAEKISKISDYIGIENKIETLVTAKGIKDCLAVVNADGTKVDIIIDCDDLSEQQILQIKEIAVAQLSCTYEAVTIIQSGDQKAAQTTTQKAEAKTTTTQKAKQ